MSNILEEIKKLERYKVQEGIITEVDTFINDIETIDYDKVLEILDKYQDKYKLAWEELKNNLGISDEDISTSNGIDELERKYNIGSEDR